MARILVVDDYPAILTLLQLMLAAAGHEVLTANDGLTGLDLASRAKPDLVLIDVDMPERCGMSVCGELKRDPATMHIPVLMMTGRLCVETIELAREAGASAVLPKPFSRAGLLEEIAWALSTAALTSG